MNLKQRLDYHYKAFDKTKIEPDPLQFLHLYTNPEDIETAGFISSVFAYGNVTQINKTLKRIFDISADGPYDFVYNYDKIKAADLENLKHRFYTSSDIDNFFKIYKRTLLEWTSLKNLFLMNYEPSQKNIKISLNHFSGYFIEQTSDPSPGLKFMFPLPDKGSSCKRMNLFLRWMIRKDDLDFGLWKEIETSKLIIPVDTHVARICRKLGLTTKKNVSWSMSEEITDNLRKFDPVDPVKYDFAICHIGMRKLKF